MDKGIKYWLFEASEKINPSVVDSQQQSFEVSCECSEPLAQRNLGFLLSREGELHGIFMLRPQPTGQFHCYRLKALAKPMSKKHLLRLGLLSLLARQGDTHLRTIRKSDYKQLSEMIRNINRQEDLPLAIALLHSYDRYSLLIRSGRFSPELLFPLEKKDSGLKRAGSYLMRLKQEVQDASGDYEGFEKSYNNLKRHARSITTTLFANADAWRFFSERYIMMSNTEHGGFPWELLTFGNYNMAMSRNFSRRQIWDGHVFAGDRMARKHEEPSLVFLDLLRTQKTNEEWQHIQRLARLFGLNRVAYFAPNSEEDLIFSFSNYTVVHLVAHGQIYGEQLYIELGAEHGALPLDPGALFMPYPVLLVAHLCAATEFSKLSKPSFPAHHILLPDIHIKEGGQQAFLQAFYSHVFNNDSFAVSVKLARQAARESSQDPFAFVYYGNGRQNLELSRNGKGA